MMQRKFNLYDKVRIKVRKHKNYVGVITSFFNNGDRYLYQVSNHYVNFNHHLGSYCAYELTPISNDEYINNLLKL